MKEEQKHSLPWSISSINEYTIDNCNSEFIIEAKDIQTAEFIVTACNSYHTLKQQNEELDKSCLAYKETAEKLSEHINEYNKQIVEIKADIQEMIDCYDAVTSKQLIDLLTKHKL